MKTQELSIGRANPPSNSIDIYLVYPGRGTPKDTMSVSIVNMMVTGGKVSEIYLADSSDDTMKVNAYIEKYIKGNNAVKFQPDSLKLLLSYHYFKKHNLVELMRKYFGDTPPRLFVDSGAFSAMTCGIDVDLQSYIKWLKDNESVITIYANLDTVGDAQKTYDTQKEMERAGLKPLPVFHTGEPMEWLQRYIDEGYTYICLGGMVPYASDRKKLIKWIGMCFDLVEKSGKDVKFHAFGMTNFEFMKAYPWASVDSSTWSTSFRFGQVHLFDDKLGRFHAVKFRDLKKSYKYAAIVRSYGFSPNDIAIGNEIERIKVATLSCMSFLRAEQWLNQRWAKFKKDKHLDLFITPANQMGSEAANPEVHGMIDAAFELQKMGVNNGKAN